MAEDREPTGEDEFDLPQPEGSPRPLSNAFAGHPMPVFSGADRTGEMLARFTDIWLREWKPPTIQLVPSLGKRPGAFYLPKIDLGLHGFSKALAQMAASIGQIFPPNLRNLGEDFALADIDRICVVEGIPLSDVPRRGTVITLLAAQDANERRQILARRWQSIATDCEGVLDECQGVALKRDLTFARKAIMALRGKHFEAAQALAASMLDSVLNAHFRGELNVLKPTPAQSRSRARPAAYDDYAFRKYLAVAPIWSAYQHFFVLQGDPIPTVFARHASAHAVSPQQYSRANAVQAVMLVTSLLGYLQYVESRRERPS